uniref:hypothetical protein n=1 Tax=Ciborinia camelliae TaxID=647257 RepID=UPI001FA7DFCD|nr:hypothetical protein MRV96_mgp17 [Ciborinia camelliae]UNB14697.1 hypothetical protein [Ciborinia camelliae]
MKRQFKTRKNYANVRLSYLTASKSRLFGANIILRDRKVREFTVSSGFNTENPPLSEKAMGKRPATEDNSVSNTEMNTMDNPFGSKNIHILDATATRAAASYEDSYTGNNISEDKEFQKLQYKSWMYSAAKALHDSLPDDDERKNSRNVDALIKAVTDKTQPNCEAEVFGLSEMVDKTVHDIPKWPTLTSFFGNKRKFEEDGESSTQPSKSIKESFSHITNNSPEDPTAKSSVANPENKNLDNRSPLDFVLDKQQSEPFDFTDSEE